MTPQLIAILTTASVLLATLLPGSQQSSQPRAPDPPSVVRAIGAPRGTADLAVEWVKIAVPGPAAVLAAVAQPSGAGPFPVVILLHGTHGFAREYVELAQAFARSGFLAIAACWFQGGGGPGAQFVAPIACPEAPPLTLAATPDDMPTVGALVDAARTLRGARSDRVGLFGHSRGGGAVRNYILGGGHVHAAVLNSAGYPSELAGRATEFKIPLLILHGTGDSPADGGSAFTSVQMARGFEVALRRAGQPVEAKYYEAGGHNGLFSSHTLHEDEVERMVSFGSRERAARHSELGLLRASAHRHERDRAHDCRGYGAPSRAVLD
jgi:dienelactone hydrolase